MEALQALDDPEAIAREVRELQDQWRKAADVPRAQADALWRRFKAAHDVVWPRCEAHFAVEAQMRAENLARKNALCEKAESLAESTHWIQTAEEIKGLQAEWKRIGAVSRGREKAIWERFRAACDRFFTRRHEDLSQRKVAWAENLAKKTALCEQAEALADPRRNGTQASSALKRLQTEWKTIGPVKKTRSEAIWQRFRAACDAFFVRYAQRHDAGACRTSGGPRSDLRGARPLWLPMVPTTRRRPCPILLTLMSARRLSALRPSHEGARVARAMAAGDRGTRRRSGPRALARRAFRSGTRARPRTLAGGLRGNRPRPRRESQADGGAGRSASRRSRNRGWTGRRGRRRACSRQAFVSPRC